MLSTYAFSYLI